MQFSPVQTMYAPTAPHMSRAPQVAGPRPNQPDPPDIDAPLPPGQGQNNAPNVPANQNGNAPNGAGVLSVKTKSGVKASYSEQSMSFKLTDKAAGETLIGFGTNAFALYNAKRGIAAAISPTQDLIVQSGQQSIKLGNLSDPQTAAKLQSFLPTEQCRDLLIAARTHDLAKTALGQRVVQDAPDWLQTVKQRQMMDPRVLALPAVQRIIAQLRQQPARTQGPRRPTTAADMQRQIDDAETETKGLNAEAKAFGSEEAEQTQEDTALADSANPPPPDTSDPSSS